MFSPHSLICPGVTLHGQLLSFYTFLISALLFFSLPSFVPAGFARPKPFFSWAETLARFSSDPLSLLG